jgi:hypothetical protein
MKRNKPRNKELNIAYKRAIPILIRRSHTSGKAYIGIFSPVEVLLIIRDGGFHKTLTKSEIDNLQIKVEKEIKDGASTKRAMLINVPTKIYLSKILTKTPEPLLGSPPRKETCSNVLMFLKLWDKIPESNKVLIW